MGIPLSIVDICNSGALTWQMAGYLSLIVEEGMNFFVSGETASGKTTLMNALMTFIRPDAKIVSIEDTPEVQVPHPNWTREVVRGAMSQGGGSVDMFSLLKAALRQRPNEIISYDPIAGSFSFIEVFRWDPVKDEFEFIGLNNSYLLEQRIAPTRGLTEKKRRMIYKEVDRRGALLQKLGESGVGNFYELFKLLSKAQKQGLF